MTATVAVYTPPPQPSERNNKLPPKRASFAAAVVLTLGISITGPLEGLRLEPYFDIVGVATVCFGQTGAAAAPGSSYTKPQCEAMLGAEMLVFAKRLDKCVSADARMTPLQQAVILSWAYNVGWYAACTSTLVRWLNEGRSVAQWCGQLLRWDKAGKPPRPWWGLTRRRKHEHALCVSEFPA
jgi:lysozyme